MLKFTAWRGEHGPGYDPLPEPKAYCFQSRHASLSFGAERVARHYALHPNTPRLDGLNGTCPRLIQAELTVNRPVIFNKDDAFVEMEDLIEKIGEKNVQTIALLHAQWFYNTNLWDSEFGHTYPTMHALLDHRPELLKTLYVQIYPLLDDPRVIGLMRTSGFDGAIYAGTGAFPDEPEYRVFDATQAQILQIKALMPGHLLAPM